MGQVTMKKFIEWFKSLFKTHIEVTLWFSTVSDGLPKTDKVTYVLKRLDKINDKELKGIEENGNKLHMKCTVPFDFRVRKGK